MMRRTWFSLAAAGALCLVFSGACGSEEPEKPTPNQPKLADAKIVSFQASSDTVIRGEKVQLTWQTEDADDIKLFAGEESISVAGRSPRDGGVEVTVLEETTFRFVAIGPSKVEVSSTALVKVRAPGEPGIEKFTAEPEEVVAGQLAALQWRVVDAEEVTISTEERVITTSRTLDGSFNVTPTTTTAYTLTATGPGGEATAEVTVAVAPAIMRFEVNPNTVGASPEQPAEVNVVWQTVGAQSVQLVAEPGGIVDITGKGADFGTVAVEIVGDTTFILTAEGDGTQSSKTIAVSTSAVPVISTFFAPEVVGAGESFLVEWDVKNAISIEMERNGVALTAVPSDRFQGQHIDSLASGRAHYVIRAVGEQTTAEAEVEVRVGAPEIVSFAPSVERAEPGDTVSVEWETKGGSTLVLLDGAGNEVLRTTSRSEIRAGQFRVALSTTPAHDFHGFTLKISNTSGEAEAWTGFGVGDGPAVERFSAEPAAIAAGLTTSLSWAVGPDADGTAPDVTLVDHEGTSHDVTAAGGRYEVTLEDAGFHTFTLEVTTALGSMSSTVVVEVVGPPSATLTSTPSTLSPSALPEVVTLEWTTSNAVQVEIFHEDDQGVRSTVTLRMNSPQVDQGQHPAQVTELPAKFVAVATNSFGVTSEASVTITSD